MNHQLSFKHGFAMFYLRLFPVCVCLIVWIILFAGRTKAGEVSANYITGNEVPISAAGYTAAGNTIEFTLGYAPTVGTELMVVDNTSLHFIDGTFDNLPNGAHVDLSFGGANYRFVAWYFGGSGNDLVLRWRDTGLAAWGQNEGKLGDGTWDSRNTPVQVKDEGVLADKTVVALSSGVTHSLALCSDGTLVAWGQNGEGQLGRGPNGEVILSRVPSPVDQSGVLAGKTVVAIEASATHSLVLCSDGTLASWGGNFKGKLGDGTTVDRYVPVLVDQSGVLSGKSVVAITSGAAFNMVLCADGTLATWGNNANNELGNGTTIDSSTPVLVKQNGVLSGKRVVAIDCGGFHSLVLCEDGTLASWGMNWHGMLGRGGTSNSSSPVLVNQRGVLAGRTVVKIAAGGVHNMVLCSDGVLVSWGANVHGTIGDGSTTNRTVPVLVDQSGVLAGKEVTGIAVGYSQSLVTCSDGTLAAWGNNVSGQLGDGTNIRRPTPVLVDQGGDLADRPVTLLEGFSGDHSLVAFGGSPEVVVEQPRGVELVNGGSVNFGTIPLKGSKVGQTFIVRNSGSFDLKEVGISIDGVDAESFKLIQNTSSVIPVGQSKAFSILFGSESEGAKTATLNLVSNDGDENPFRMTLTGMVGAQSSVLEASYTTGKEVPLKVGSLIATGNQVNLTLNHAPEIGAELMVVEKTGLDFIEGTFDNLPNGMQVNLSYGDTIYRFTAWYYGGDGNDLVLVWSGTGLSAWGYNLHGELGDGTEITRTVPGLVDQSGVLAGKTVVKVSGSRHSFALCSDGTLAGWGLSFTGQIGNGEKDNKNLPVLVDQSGVLAGKTIIAIEADYQHSLALCADGTLAEWGNDVTLPALVDQSGVLAGKTVVKIAMGRSHRLVLCSDGTLAAWGSNHSGNLGDGSSDRQDSPVLVDHSGVLAGRTVTAISVGENHNLVLCLDGTLAAWGDNVYGQLGAGRKPPGTRLSERVPGLVEQSGELAGKSVKQIAAGGHYSLALCTDGTLVAWGDNQSGQLGDNTTTNKWTPVPVDQSGVLSGKTITDIAAGGDHSLVYCSDGTLASWGQNSLGQLGNGTEIHQSAPVLVDQSGVLKEHPVSGFGRCGENYSLVISATAPEVAVEQPMGNGLVDGGIGVDFGIVELLGSEVAKTFTVRNTGTFELKNVGIYIDGSNARDFQIVQSPAPVVPVGASTTFKVHFAANTLGPKYATLHLMSSDGDESSFDIALSGGGTSKTVLEANYLTGQEDPLVAGALDATGRSVNFSLGFAPAVGTELSVVNNTGRDFISGSFENLPNGELVDLTFDGVTYRFTAWYYGGDGNDLVLLWRGTGLASWGSNYEGKLGNGSLSDQEIPVLVDRSGVLASKTIVAVASGESHSMALCSDGTLASWGQNSSGQLGDGSMNSSFSPVLVDRSGVLAGKTVISIAGGLGHSLALCSDGTLAAWGQNAWGELGDGTLLQRTTPVLVNQSGVLQGKKVIAIESGRYQNLALCSDGTLVAWGGVQSSSTLGDGKTSKSSNPILVDQSGVLARKTVIAIEANMDNSMVLCSDGTVAGWGDNGDGELGVGSGFYWRSPVLLDQSGVLEGKTVISIAAGRYHGLVLCSDGTLASFGDNRYGQLGDGSWTSRWRPVLVNQSGVLAGKRVIKITSDGYDNMVLCSDGTLATWGRNYLGQLGDGTEINRSSPVLVDQGGVLAGRPVLGFNGFQKAHSVVIFSGAPDLSVEGPDGTKLTNGVSEVDFGGVPIEGGELDQTLTIRNVGTYELIGLEAGIAGADPDHFQVVQNPAAIVPAGGETTIVIRFSSETTEAKSATLNISSNDGDEAAFSLELTGSGTNNSVLQASYSTGGEVPLVVGALTATGRTVDLNLDFAPTVGTELQIVENSGLEFIKGTFDNLPNGSAVDLPFNGKVYRFTAWYYGGNGNDLVLLWRDTVLTSWGNNMEGQLGDGTETRRSSPVFVDQSRDLSGKTIVSHAIGDTHNLVLCSDGTLAAWGGNEFGQLGDGGAEFRNRPALVEPSGVFAGKSVVALSAGENHSLALFGDGTLASWGANSSGQLGDGTLTDRPVPVTLERSGVLLGKKVVMIASGKKHSLALCSDGTLAAWGENSNGQLGDGTTTNRERPVFVDQSGLLDGKTIVAIDAGSLHSVALCSDGTIASWGAGYSGRLGDGGLTNIPASKPVLVDQAGVLSDRSVVAIAAGDSHTLALCSDGAVAAWGHNSVGALGDGSRSSRNTPVLVDVTGVLAGKEVVRVSAGKIHSMALCADGTLAAWGDNRYGHLGDGTRNDTRLPIQVVQNGVMDGKVVAGIGAGGAHSLGVMSISSVPEIEVRGNGVEILVDDLEPGQTDHTDFGEVSAGGNVLRAFTIRNSGGSDLNLTGMPVIEVGGANAADFSVTNLPADMSLAPGESAVFEVNFVPSAYGMREATLRIPNNDSDEASFTYAIRGRGILPGIEVTSTIGIPNGERQEFGPTIAGKVVSVNFSVRNSGLDILSDLSILKDGANAADFTVVGDLPGALMPDASTNFTVEFSPAVFGERIAAIYIASNVPGQSPYVINLRGHLLSYDEDSDGDGLSDAAEFQWAGLGFDWQDGGAEQVSLVERFNENASASGFYDDVQYEENRVKGQNDVTSDPNAFGLYNLAQIQALNVGHPLLQINEEGLLKLTIGIEKSPGLDQPFTPFPMLLPQTTINGKGQLEFLFAPADDTVFFRLNVE